MKWWHDFIDTLSTKGGAIFILVTLWIITLGMVMYMMKTGVNGDYKTIVLGTFSGWSTGLGVALGVADRTRRATDNPPEKPEEKK